MIKVNQILFYILLVLTVFTSCNDKPSRYKKIKKLSDLRVLDSLHAPLSEAKPGEWLYSQDEKGQTFKKYIKSHPVCPTIDINKIYIQLIGEFSERDLKVMKDVSSYIKTFLGLEVVTLDVISDSIIPTRSKRIHHGINQLHTKYILYKVLLPNIPKDAITFTAITSKDLYPADDWNYVFGQATLKHRVGVSSIYRYKNEDLDSIGYKTYLKRIMKTATHELIHMFSIKHCIKYTCLMNGSMSLFESDSRPSWLCPECMAKLTWCTKYNIIIRYEKLIKFCIDNNFNDEKEFYMKSIGLLLKK